jgi:hypothetical protein
MENKMSFLIMALLILSLLANIVLIVMLRSHGEVTGFATNTENKALFESDVVEINKADLTQCCSFINKEGKEGSCYSLKGYDCTYCEAYCS